MLFAFQSNSEVVQLATCFHNHIPKFGTTETDDVVNNPIPLDIAELPKKVREELQLIPVSSMDEVLKIALAH